MYLKNPNPIRPCQGDIYSNVEYYIPYKVNNDEEGGEYPELESIQYNYCVILSQECDLEQDYKVRTCEKIISHDKLLPSIIIAPAYLAEQLRSGDHLQSLEYKMDKINRERWSVIIKNKNDRYHYLEKDLDLNIPEMVIDFKHIITIPTEFFYKNIQPKMYTASLPYLYREFLSQRYCNFLSRIGIPESETEIRNHFEVFLSKNTSVKEPLPHNIIDN